MGLENSEYQRWGLRIITNLRPEIEKNITVVLNEVICRRESVPDQD